MHRYGSLTAVDSVSLEIRQGEVFGLLGPNGAGKSTLISILSGMFAPTAGQVAVGDGQVSPTSRAAKRRIGVVPQDVALYEKLSGRQNLRFFGRVYGLGGRRLRERVEAVLEVVGLSDRGNDRAETYSGGMQRRLNLAAGLLHEPELLILDEPTVGVDPQSRNHIFDNVERLNRVQGVTIVYTTHYMEEAERLCDRVAIIDHGKIVALDTPRALIESLGGGAIQIGIEPQQRGHVTDTLSALASVQAVGPGPDERLLNIEAVSARHALVDVMQAMNTESLEVETVRILEPNLESVFLRFTGRSLRD
jgi:ABC-2 type transport system ATP-binding protein